MSFFECDKCGGIPGVTPCCTDQKKAVNMTEQLKPCPFCGGNAKLFGSNGGTPLTGWFAVCDDCGASQKISVLTDSGSETIKAWNRRAQPAQAVPVLTLDEMAKAFAAAGLDPDTPCEHHLEIARAIEQAVLAKRVPMTRSELVKLSQEYADLENEEDAFRDGWRQAELHHGIVGKEGA